MATRDNAPPPADRTPQPGNTCGNCAATSNYCHVIDSIDRLPCCPECSHISPRTQARTRVTYLMSDPRPFDDN